MTAATSFHPTPPTSPPPPAPPRLIDQLRLTARQRGHAEPTVAAFADWSLRFIRFHRRKTKTGTYVNSCRN